MGAFIFIFHSCTFYFELPVSIVTIALHFNRQLFLFVCKYFSMLSYKALVLLFIHSMCKNLIQVHQPQKTWIISFVSLWFFWPLMTSLARKHSTFNSQESTQPTKSKWSSEVDNVTTIAEGKFLKDLLPSILSNATAPTGNVHPLTISHAPNLKKMAKTLKKDHQVPATQVGEQ